MAFKTLVDLSEKLQAAMRSELAISTEEIGLVQWGGARTQVRVIVEVWDRDASSGRCAKRYLISRVFWLRDALDFVGTFEMPNIHHTVVPVEEAQRRLLELELAAPSEEFLDKGRIWDCQTENCLRGQRLSREAWNNVAAEVEELPLLLAA